MTSDTADWLRAELAADWEAAVDYSLVDWLVVVVETVVALAMVVRLSAAAVVYLTHHREPGGVIRTNPFVAPIDDDVWTADDAMATALLGLLFAVIISLGYNLDTLGEWTIGVWYVAAQGGTLAWELLRVLLFEVWR